MAGNNRTIRLCTAHDDGTGSGLATRGIGRVCSQSARRAVLPLALVAGFAGLVLGVPARAQASRTWVSGTGNDTNACTRTAPCRTFAGAFDKTVAAGEIDCLDPGDFGPVTITRSLIISCSGIGNGAILAVGGGDGVTINAGAGDIVVLDGLEIAGVGVGGNGIVFNTGAALTVRDTTVRRFVNAAILFRPTGTSTLNVDVSALLNCARGIDVSPRGAASVRTNVSRSQISNNAAGVYADGSATTGGVFVSIRATTITSSTDTGVSTKAATATYATVALDEVTVAGSGGAGLLAMDARSGMLVNNTTITNNLGGGIRPVSGGVIYSYGNNRVNGNNAQDGSFTGVLQLR